MTQMCPAGRHDMDVVGIMPPSPSRRRITGKGTCRECDRERKRRYYADTKGSKASQRYLQHDGIVDELAIWIIVSGIRVGTPHAAPQLTREETDLAVAQMVAKGFGAKRIAEHLGVKEETAAALIGRPAHAYACQHCGASLHKRRGDSLYCSERCNNATKNAKQDGHAKWEEIKADPQRMQAHRETNKRYREAHKDEIAAKRRARRAAQKGTAE